MKKQYLLAGAGILAVALLFIFSRTTDTQKPIITPGTGSNTRIFDIQHFIEDAKAKLTPAQALYVTKLENGISRGDVPAQQVMAYNGLADFWKDSIASLEPYLFYLSEASKLDNSEKKLTFAAQLFLEGLRGEQDEAKLNWETTEAIDLFERAIKLDPENDDLRIGLGSCYVYGKGRSGNPQETMKGIQELLAVARKDSSNMKAQVVLGVGGLVSGQYDKALERFHRVISKEPKNLEAIAYLADTYAAKGNKEEAIRWYNISKRLANNPHYTEEVDKRINSLK
ncbi:MAG: tetratricopeptide repeat protein [Ferruginibacter sp.]